MLDGDLDGAVAAYTEASHLLAELGHREDLSQVQLRLAEIAARRGDLARARELSAAARAAAESEGSPIDRGIAAAWWAALRGHVGRHRRGAPAAGGRRAAPRAVRPRAPGARSPGGHGGGHRPRGSPSPTPTCRAAREQAARSYRAAVAAQDMPLLALASGSVAELALALGQPERAAELLGASAVVRGGDDPTDPTAVKLMPRLRAALGADRYERCRARGPRRSAGPRRSSAWTRPGSARRSCGGPPQVRRM